jgi:hypothetical protein
MNNEIKGKKEIMSIMKLNSFSPVFIFLWNFFVSILKCKKQNAKIEYTKRNKYIAKKCKLRMKMVFSSFSIQFPLPEKKSCKFIVERARSVGLSFLNFV